MAPAALEFGRRGDKSIKGPTMWNGIEVYEREYRDSKIQLFALCDDRTGLGRVYDSRARDLGCRGEVKFPLGRWKQGERRAALAALPLAVQERTRPGHRYALHVQPSARAGRRAR